jgi:hypothetical protein
LAYFSNHSLFASAAVFVVRLWQALFNQVTKWIYIWIKNAYFIIE